MDTLLVLLWAAELGVGLLESWDVQLPRPTAWARLIERILNSLAVPQTDH
jgi:hypothetical protein